jgi:hypothetical protein
MTPQSTPPMMNCWPCLAAWSADRQLPMTVKCRRVHLQQTVKHIQRQGGFASQAQQPNRPSPAGQGLIIYLFATSAQLRSQCVIWLALKASLQIVHHVPCMQLPRVAATVVPVCKHAASAAARQPSLTPSNITMCLDLLATSAT